MIFRGLHQCGVTNLYASINFWNHSVTTLNYIYGGLKWISFWNILAWYWFGNRGQNWCWTIVIVAYMYQRGNDRVTVYPKKYAHGFCFAVLCCGYTLTDFPISIRLTSLALWQSNDCPSASKATLMNMDKYLMWIHYERLHNHNKAKHNNIVCIFLGIYCIWLLVFDGHEATCNPVIMQGIFSVKAMGQI